MTIRNTVKSVLEVGSEVTLGFTDLLANGQAVGRHGGVVLFVSGPLPGEKARVRVTLVKAKYAVGEMVELTVRSRLRAQPFCKVFGVCGGCQVQHLEYLAQLSWKEHIVRNALRRIGGIEGAVVARPVGMINPRAYRNKMALVAGAGPRTRFGFYQARTHALVPVTTCPVVVPQLDATIGRLNEAANDPQTAPAFNGAKHVVVRAGTASGQSVVSVTTDRPSQSLMNTATALAKKLPGVVGVSNSFDPGSANAVMGRKFSSLWGRPEMEEGIRGVRFRVSAGSFFQVNSEMVGRIFDFMAPGLAERRKIVDLYCGAGTFSIFFALKGSTVVGIEENGAAVREARANAGLNGVESSASFLAGRVEAVLASPQGREALAEAEIVFLDPPRKGSDEATLLAVAEARVANIWYLSCNPATLARDLAFLRARGYALGVVQPFDMFPQTGHIETLVSMYRLGGEKLDLPPPEVDEPFTMELPVWPAEEKFSYDVPLYPDFVDR